MIFFRTSALYGQYAQIEKSARVRRFFVRKKKKRGEQEKAVGEDKLIWFFGGLSFQFAFMYLYVKPAGCACTQLGAQSRDQRRAAADANGRGGSRLRADGRDAKLHQI